ncbi:ABC transporter permease (plasmid) [Aquamicrobium terrae]
MTPPKSTNYRLQGAFFFAVLIFFYLPLATLVLVSFSSGRVTEFPPPGYTLQWYTGMLANPRALSSVLTSLGVGVTAALVSTSLATAFAFGLHQRRAAWVTVLRSFGNLPLVMAPMIIGVSLLIFFNLIGMRLGYLSVTIAHVVRGFPFAAIIMATAFLSVRPSLLEAALDLGASRISAFRRVVVPAIMPGLVASLLVTFSVSFDEINSTIFVIGGGVSTVQTFILEQIEFVVTPEMNALTTVIIVATLLVALATDRLRSREDKP